MEPSSNYLEVTKRNLGGLAAFHLGNASSIPLSDNSVGVYVWDYAEKMELMRFFWDSAIELEPAAAKLDEGLRFPLCHPAALAELFTSAGLQRVEVEPGKIV